MSAIIERRDELSPKDRNHLAPSVFEELMEQYSHNPALKALVTFLISFPGPATPVLSGLEQAMIAKWHGIRQARLRQMFDALADGRLELTEEIVQREDFLHAFVATAHAVVRTRRQEKIKLLTYLLRTFVVSPSNTAADEHEYMLSIVDDLDYREFLVLLAFCRHARMNPRIEGETDLQWVSRFWDAFIKDASGMAGFPEDHIGGVLARLNRTGLYETISGGYFDYGGGQGKVTPLLDRLLELLGEDLPSL